MIRDVESGEVVGRVDYDGPRITSSTDSGQIVDLCRDQFIGPVDSVDHDNDTIHGTCSVPGLVGINPGNRSDTPARAVRLSTGTKTAKPRGRIFFCTDEKMPDQLEKKPRGHWPKGRRRNED
jgi:hypothetical protein